MRADAADWYARRTSRAADWPLERLAALKGDARISVVLPALDEEATVGAIAAAIRRDLCLGPHPLVDDLLVLDSGSSDRTAEVAREAGARVVHRDEVLPGLPAVPGKGEAMWRSLAATDGDLIVFIDADLLDFSATYVTGLLGPLLADPTVQLVKGLYDRPLAAGHRVLPAGGGRVTELVARPLLALHWPQLAGVVQPLAGETALRRGLAERLPFPTGYGIELALLVDTLAADGLDAIAQVDLGVRHHRHQDEHALGRMAAEIWVTALARLDRDGRLPPGAVDAEPTLTQFVRGPAGFEPVEREIAALERPPMARARVRSAAP
jgi:glucosyl-3-phosphoglycerate synthase